MKNLFNDISQEEKNRILEMHSSKKIIVNEQSSTQGIPGMEWLTPEQQKMVNYSRIQWEEGKPNSVKTEVNSKSLSMANQNGSQLIFDGNKNLIIYDKNNAIDPKPISMIVTFDVFKKWFDSNNNYNPLSGMF